MEFLFLFFFFLPLPHGMWQSESMMRKKVRFRLRCATASFPCITAQKSGHKFDSGAGKNYDWYILLDLFKWHKRIFSLT